MLEMFSRYFGRDVFIDNAVFLSERATGHRNPWKLIYYEAYLNQADAMGRERYLKSGAGRGFLKAQLRNYLAKYESINRVAQRHSTPLALRGTRTC